MDLMTTEEAAEYLRVPIGTLRYWRHIGAPLKSARIGSRVFYRKGDLDAFVENAFSEDERNKRLSA